MYLQWQFLLLLSIIPLSIQTTFLTPIQKDHTTLQYTLSLYLKTPLQPSKLHLHLGASFTWVDCSKTYNSTSYKHIPCGSSLCNSLHSLACSSNCFSAPAPACANNTCALYPENPVTHQATLSNALIDALALLSADDGSTAGQLGRISEFIFSCSQTFMLKGLADDVIGLAALGRSNYALASQVSRTFPSCPLCFALCLSGSKGVGFFGSSGPYYFLPDEIDLSKSLTYTPLVLNPVGTTVVTYNGQPSDEYFIGLTSLKVNGKVVEFNESILAIDENGFGGTKISTVNPFTVLESSVYKAFTDKFVNESSGLNLTVVNNAVQPFSVCYLASDVISTRVGPGVPTVDLVMQNDDVFWRIFGSNSMVRIEEEGVDLWCLGFVDGGVNARTAIVIGGHQMEDNLLQFDLESKRLGFSSSVLLHGTTCANFNFTLENNFKL